MRVMEEVYLGLCCLLSPAAGGRAQSKDGKNDLLKSWGFCGCVVYFPLPQAAGLIGGLIFVALHVCYSPG